MRYILSHNNFGQQLLLNLFVDEWIKLSWLETHKTSWEETKLGMNMETNCMQKKWRELFSPYVN